MEVKVSFVIRAKNEAKWLPSVLESLENQTEQGFEVILVDNESTDKTVDIFKNSKLANKKIITIKEGQFTYPSAANLGAKNAKAPYVAFLSGHSIPIKDGYVKAVITELSDKNVAGVYGDSYPLPDSSMWEKILYRDNSKKNKRTEVKRIKVGLMGMTSAAIKKDLWDKYPFNEIKCKNGGEDTEWAYHHMLKGYKIVYSPQLLVRHSHSYGLLRFIIQYVHWLTVFVNAYLINKDWYGNRKS